MQAMFQKRIGEDGDMELLDQIGNDEEHEDVPARKRMRLEIRAENILKQTSKPNGGPWLRSDTKLHQRAPILSLPPEIIHNIFFRLSKNDRQVLSAVCKDWMSLMSDPIFHTRLVIKKEAPCSFYCQVLQQSPLLKQLRIFEREDLGLLLTALKKFNPFLEELTVHGLIPNKDDHYLNYGTCFTKLKYFTNLRSLELTNVTMYYKNTVKSLSELKNLKKLELSDCNLNLAFLNLIAESNVRLEEFNYRNIFSSFVPKIAFKNFFEKMGPSLRVVKLSIPKLTKHIVESILANCKELTFLELRLRYKFIGNSWLELLGSLRHLEHLNLFEVQCTNASSWNSLLSQPSLARLKSLNLSFCTNPQLSVFETIGNNLKELESLSLNCYNAGETGLEHVIKNCSKLKSLTLSSLINSATLENLVLIPKYLPKLEVLSLRQHIGCYNEQQQLLIEQIELMTPGLKINYLHRYNDFLH